MISNINKFTELLEKLNLNFCQELAKNNHNDNSLKQIIEQLYFQYKDFFPLDLQSIFDELRLEDSEFLKTFIWDKSKVIFFIYEDFIVNEFKYLNNSNFGISDEIRNLFNHTKKLAGDYFRLTTKYYYMHYGKYQIREKKSININFLNDYYFNSEEFIKESEIETIQGIRHHYAYQYQLVERDVRQSYTTNDIVVKIQKPKYPSNDHLNNELKKLNEEYVPKLEILKNFKSNIVKMTTNLEFTFPNYLSTNNINPKVTFINPDKVFNALKALLSMTEFEESLRRLIFGEICKIESGININLNSSDLGIIFKYLYDIGYIKCTNKSDIISFLTDNFRYKKSGKYLPVQKEGIKKNIFTQNCFTKADLPKTFTIETQS